MDKPISVGDLVMVVHSHCAAASLRESGRIETVLAVDYWDQLTCGSCDEQYPSSLIARLSHDGWLPVSWLKRIPPLSEPEQITEEATA